MSGYIYCFNTHENPNIIKAGYTQQDNYKKRFQSYIGPTKPRSVFFTMKVDDAIEAEKMMLQLMNQCASICKRCDLGNEWFQTIGEFTFEQRASHLQTIAKIVQKASSTQSIIPPSNSSGQNFQAANSLENVPTAHWILGVNNAHKKFNEENNIRKLTIKTNSFEVPRGLELYFKKFDDFVSQEATKNFSAVNLLRSYEASTFCPNRYLCQFLPVSESDRLKIVAHRYQDFLT